LATVGVYDLETLSSWRGSISFEQH